MKSSKFKVQSSKFGFTLIELLIVIAIIGIMATALIVGINPADKIKTANDSKVQADISQIATAEETYAVSKNGFYATTQAYLVAAGELKGTRVQPAGYTAYTFVISPNRCTSGRTCMAVAVCGQLKQAKYATLTPFWVWCSATGKAGPKHVCPTNPTSTTQCP